MKNIDKIFEKKQKQSQKRKAPPSVDSPIRQNLLLLFDAFFKGHDDIVKDLLYNKDISLSSTQTDDEGYTVFDWALMLGIIEYVD